MTALTLSPPHHCPGSSTQRRQLAGACLPALRPLSHSGARILSGPICQAPSASMPRPVAPGHSLPRDRGQAGSAPQGEASKSTQRQREAGGETARNRFEGSELQHTLTIPMRARGKQRPRVYGKRTVTPPETVAAEARIAAEWQAARLPMVEGPIALHVEAVYAMPASWSMKRKLAALGAPMESTPDFDNVAKLISDALNSVAYPDDRHITHCGIRQIWGDADKLTITVSAIPVREDSPGKVAVRAAIAGGEVTTRDVEICMNIHHDAMEAGE